MIVIFSALVSTGIIFLGLYAGFKKQQYNRLVSDNKFETKEKNNIIKEQIKTLKAQDKAAINENNNIIKEKIKTLKNLDNEKNEKEILKLEDSYQTIKDGKNISKILKLKDKILFNNSKFKESKNRIKIETTENFELNKEIKLKDIKLENESWIIIKEERKSDILKIKGSNESIKDIEDVKAFNDKIKLESKDKYEQIKKDFINKKEQRLERKSLRKDIKKTKNEFKLSKQHYIVIDEYKKAKKLHAENIKDINEKFLKSVS